jgi:hypothetical protein
MARLLLLFGLAFAAWRLLGRRRSTGPRAVVGYEDGSSVSLEAGSPQAERLAGVARRALAP